MKKIFLDLFAFFDFHSFLIAAALFAIGILAAVVVVRRNNKFFLRYPLWLWEQLQRFLSRQPSWQTLFLFIFCFNSCSLLINLVSGFGIILPYIFAVYLGLNIGIIGYKEAGSKALLLMCLAPHALIELPAAWLSLMSGMQIGKLLLSGQVGWMRLLLTGLLFFLLVILPLLLLAALVEVILIRAGMRFLQHSSPLAQVPLQAEQKNHRYQQHKQIP